MQQLEGIYENGIIKLKSIITKTPKKVYVFLDYGDEDEQENKKQKIDLNSIVGII